jgi:glutathione S-transferase
MLELYHADRSTCSQKVRICLAELGLPFVPHAVNLMAGEQLTPQYLAINPNGVVPALVHDGAVVVESTVICEYLCEVFPDPQHLLPADALGRARVRAWLRYIDEVPSMAVRVPTFQLALVPFYRRMSEHQFAEFIEAMPLRKYFFQKMGREGFSELEYANSLEQLRRSFARLAPALERTGWIAGDHYTIADLCMVPVVRRVADLGLAQLWDDYPAVGAWFERVAARPAYAQAFYPGTDFELAEIRKMVG